MQISPRTVRRYMPNEPRRKQSTQSWMTFVRNHAKSIIACDFFVVVTTTLDRKSTRLKLQSHRDLHSCPTRRSSDLEPRRKQSTQSWMTFVRNHAKSIIACDFFVVVTTTFRLVYVFIVMEIGTRRILHLNVTAHPMRNGQCSSSESV